MLGEASSGPARARIGLAGLRRRGAEAAFNQVSHPFGSVAFISDGLAACLGADGGPDGAIVVAGTGSVSVGLIDGRDIRVTGNGFTVSDERSGADIGLQVVGLAVRTEGRRGELTSLLSEALGAFDHDPYQAVAWSEEARGNRLRGIRADRDATCQSARSAARGVLTPTRPPARYWWHEGGSTCQARLAQARRAQKRN
ncbi:BadF/BadG/BcrA/BcrD ATPase family protein [Bradyrhizobium sp. HKCCYLS1011]|uniref:BadF/BadG/BcrA/BcrD ATPase family protein n=1 Tax=Bradyrhizobium sp. HKCCYLS1011 TaxID=3420733 RepID=UPI003EB9A547